MTDFTPETPQVPSFVDGIVTAILQKILTGAAVWMGANGFLNTSSQQGEFVQIGIALALGAVSFAWTFAHQKHVSKTMAVLAAAPAQAPIQA